MEYLIASSCFLIQVREIWHHFKFGSIRDISKQEGHRE